MKNAKMKNAKFRMQQVFHYSEVAAVVERTKCRARLKPKTSELLRTGVFPASRGAYRMDNAGLLNYSALFPGTPTNSE